MLEIIFECGVPSRRDCDGCESGVTQRRASQVGVDDDASSVDNSAWNWLHCVFQKTGCLTDERFEADIHGASRQYCLTRALERGTRCEASLGLRQLRLTVRGPVSRKRVTQRVYRRQRS